MVGCFQLKESKKAVRLQGEEDKALKRIDVKRVLLHLIGKVAEKEAGFISSEKAPICALFFYQPKRPKRK